MFTCVCGRKYKHQPNLSRHRNGSDKNGIRPCPEYLKSLMIKCEAKTQTTPAESLLERFEKILQGSLAPTALEGVSTPLPYADDQYPSFIENLFAEVIPISDKPFNDRLSEVGRHVAQGRAMRRLVDLFRMIHFDLGHPEYWNVLLANVKTMRFMTYTKNGWRANCFKELARDFGKTYLSRYCTQVENDDPQAVCFYMDLLCSGDKKVLREYYRLFMQMLQNEPDIRQKVKERHQMR